LTFFKPERTGTSTALNQARGVEPGLRRCDDV
jgi:hypothetical protein